MLNTCSPFARGTLLLLTLTGILQASTTYDFSLVPTNGQLTAAAGETVEWGYTLTNQDSTLWLVPTNLQAGSFLFGTPLSVFDFPILAPQSTISGTLYAFSWDLGAPDGSINDGVFILSVDWYDGDPFLDGQFVQSGDDISASYSTAVSSVPEPNGTAGGVMALMIMFAARRKLIKVRGRRTP